MRKLVKRRQWKMWGGMVYVRIYSDGSSRVRTDHPSNEPAVEVAMMGEVMARVTAAFRDAGVEPKWGDTMTLRDDPPKP